MYLFIGLLASSTVRISFALRTSTSRLFRMFCSPRYSAVFFLLFAGFSLYGYLLGSCVRMASGHPSPRCPVSGTFAAGVLLSSPRCPVRASFASAFSFFVCPSRRMSSGFSFFFSPALNAGLPFVHCAGCYSAFISSIVPDAIRLLRVNR